MVEAGKGECYRRKKSLGTDLDIFVLKYCVMQIVKNKKDLNNKIKIVLQIIIQYYYILLF